jgi:thiamine-monophosphate kinase
MDEKERTEIASLGEFRLIDHLTKSFKVTNPHTTLGIGDDAAIVDAQGKKVLLTTDLLIEGVHFDLMYTPLKHLGYKAAVVNFSDIAAMNAFPAQITVSISVSNRFSVEAIEELYEGIRLACEFYHVDLIGGDTTSGRSGLLISITAVGYSSEQDIVTRSGAQENDLICVSGDLGAAYAGLLLLEREKVTFQANPEMQPDLDGYDYVLQRQLKPEARVDIVNLLKEKEIVPTAMIDISDGLASEILHLAANSKKGAALYPEKFPIDPQTAAVAEEFKMDATTLALNGGEDYELLFTIRPGDYEKIKDIKAVSVIGHIMEENAGVNIVNSDTSLTPVTAQGWDSFRK